MTRAIGLFLIILKINKLNVPTTKLSIADILDDWKLVLIFGLHLIFGNLYFQMDTLLLSFWKGDTQVGIYQTAYKIMMFTLIIPDVLLNAFLPVLSNSYFIDRTKWINLSKFLQKTLFMISIPLVLILFIYSREILHLIYGTSIATESNTILKIFSILIFIRFSSEAPALMLTTSGKQFKRLIAVILAVILNFSLNSYLIPLLGSVGAAVVLLCTNTFVGICYFLFNNLSIIKYFFGKLELSFITGAIFIGLIFNSFIHLNWILGSIIILTISIIPITLFGYSKEERLVVFNPKSFFK